MSSNFHASCLFVSDGRGGYGGNSADGDADDLPTWRGAVLRRGTQLARSLLERGVNTYIDGDWEQARRCLSDYVEVRADGKKEGGEGARSCI